MQRFFKFAYIQVNTKQSPVNLLHIFGSLFFKSTSEELLLKTINGKEQMNMWYKQVLMLEYFMSEFIAKSIGGKFCGCRSICKSMSFVICPMKSSDSSRFLFQLDFIYSFYLFIPFIQILFVIISHILCFNPHVFEISLLLLYYEVNVCQLLYDFWK